MRSLLRKLFKDKTNNKELKKKFSEGIFQFDFSFSFYFSNYFVCRDIQIKKENRKFKYNSHLTHLGLSRNKKKRIQKDYL